MSVAGFYQEPVGPGGVVTDGRQISAARAVLGWTGSDLAKAAGLHRNSVTKAEAAHRVFRDAHAAKMIGKALNEAGIVFTLSDAGPGIAFPGNAQRVSRRGSLSGKRSVHPA